MRCLTFILCTALACFTACGSSNKTATRTRIHDFDLPCPTEVKKLNPETVKEAQYHYDLAYGHLVNPQGNQAEAALKEIVQSIELNDSDPQARNLLGLVLMGRSVYLDAMKHFQCALQLKPDFYEAQNNLGTAYLSMERWDDAIEVYEKLTGAMLYAWPAHAHNNLAWALYKKGRLEQARRHYLTAIELKPEFCLSYNNLGMLEIDLEDYELAARYLERGIKRCPNYAEPHFHMGRVAEAQRDMQGAAQFYSRCTELAGESPLADRCVARLRAIKRAIGR